MAKTYDKYYLDQLLTPIDSQQTNEITCPVCGYEFSDSGEYPADGEDECEQCGSKFLFERNIEVSYSTRILELCEDAEDYLEDYDEEEYKAAILTQKLEIAENDLRNTSRTAEFIKQAYPNENYSYHAEKVASLEKEVEELKRNLGQP